MKPVLPPMAFDALGYMVARERAHALDIAKQAILSRSTPPATRMLAEQVEALDQLQLLTKGANERMSIELSVFEEWERDMLKHLAHGDADHRRWLADKLAELSAQRKATTRARLEAARSAT